MSVVGIDPSLTSCGVAVLDCVDGTAVIRDLTSFGREGRKGDTMDRRVTRVVAQTHRIMRHIPDDVELVVVEALPHIKNPMPSYHDRCALFVGLWSQLQSRKIPRAMVNVSTLKLWSTGKGNADKATMLATAIEQWPDERRLRNDDEADALAAADLGALHLGWRLPFEIKQRHHEGLKKVAWPEPIGAMR